MNKHFLGLVKFYERVLKLSFSRKGRLLVTILGPPLLGGLIVSAIIIFFMIFIEDTPLTQKIFGAAPIVIASVIWAYIFVGVQSLVAGLLMEFVVRRLATRKIHIVVSAIIMGLLSAAAYKTDSLAIITLGLLIGTIGGLFLAYSFQPRQSTNN